MRVRNARHYHSLAFNASAKLFVVGHRKGSLWELYRVGFAIALVVHSFDPIRSLDQSLFTSLIPLQTADVGTVSCGDYGGQCPPYNYNPRDGPWGSITSREDWQGGWL